MGKCHIFDFDDANQAGAALDLELVKDYGDECNGHTLYVWDDGKRLLAKCKQCGALILIQKSEYHSFDDDYYTDYFPVESERDAEELNEKYDGFAIEAMFPDKYLMKTNGVWRFAND